MIVYIELVIINNLAINTLLAAGTLIARRKRINAFRIASAVLLGTAAAVWYGAAPEVWRIVIRALLAPLTVLLLTKPKDVKDYIVTLALFSALTFCLGGIVIGINNMTGIDVRGYPLLGVVAAGAAAGLMLLYTALRSRSVRARGSMQVIVDLNGDSYTASGMCDSGNTLCDIVTGLPVVMISESMEKRFAALDSRNIEGFIDVETVGGNTSFPLIKLDSVCVNGKRISAYGALTRADLGEYDLILQNTMF